MTTAARMSLGELAAAYRADARAFPNRLTWIYAIRAGDGPVKIGVAKKPMERMATLQTGNPERLRLIGVWRAFDVEEAQIHEQFAATRLCGEWFKPTTELLDLVAFLDDPLVREEWGA